MRGDVRCADQRHQWNRAWPGGALCRRRIHRCGRGRLAADPATAHSGDAPFASRLVPSADLRAVGDHLGVQFRRARHRVRRVALLFPRRARRLGSGNRPADDSMDGDDRDHGADRRQARRPLPGRDSRRSRTFGARDRVCAAGPPARAAHDNRHYLAGRTMRPWLRPVPVAEQPRHSRQRAARAQRRRRRDPGHRPPVGPVDRRCLRRARLRPCRWRAQRRHCDPARRLLRRCRRSREPHSPFRVRAHRAAGAATGSRRATRASRAGGVDLSARSCTALRLGSIVRARILRPGVKPMPFQDILYEKRDGIATITINRPKVLNAFRAETMEEMLEAMRDAEDDDEIGVVVLGGAGDRAFCSGGDNSSRDGGYGGRGLVGLPIEELHTAIRDCRKPVIAKVQGYAIGGGNVLATVCDLTIASEKAVFGQVGPRVGSVDPGWGTAFLARHVGDKRAREIWYLCRRYTAAEAFQMGLANKVVPADQLDAEVASWCQEILALSPTAIAIAKRSFNADSENIKGIGALGFEALALYYNTGEAKEGTHAFLEKRRPDFRAKRKR